MALPILNYTTGPATLRDDANNPVAGVSGTLVYNGCTFSPLVETKVSSRFVQDSANRTVKLVEHSITVDGYVTLRDGLSSIAPTMQTLYNLLSAQCGTLVYRGRGLDIITGAGSDVAWGPVPEVLEFQPLGGGLSAKIVWRVTVRLVPPSVLKVTSPFRFLQLNYETSVSYGEDGYSSFTIKGTMEIPLTRIARDNRTLDRTVDNSRNFLENRILAGIDLGRFHLTNRVFNVSRDKRTLEFDVAGTEKPYMDLPPYCTIAHGSFNVHPKKQGAGLTQWYCTLQATYTVVAGYPRALAYQHFLNLMNLRMKQTALLPSPNGGANEIPLRIKPGQPLKVVLKGKPLLVNFSFSEGLYLDSKTTSLSATWYMVCDKNQIMLASGLWRKVPEGTPASGGLTSDRRQANNLWARSMQLTRIPTVDGPSKSIMGAYSWLPNTVDPTLDIVVDMGGY